MMDDPVDNLVKYVVEKIAKEVPVDKIILFGSRATQSYQLDSDIDLLLIYDGPLPKMDILLQADQLFLKEHHFGLDLFVLSSEEFEWQKDVVSTLARTAYKKGVVCYER